MKNHPMMAVVLFIGVAVIALGSFTDALTKIGASN